MARKDAGPKVGLRATSGKRTLAFGLVRVGVGMAPLMESEKRISAKMLDPDLLTPVKQKWENADGELVERSDLVKGYEVAGGGYVVLDEGEVPTPPGTDAIDLIANVDVSEVPSEYVEKSYLIWPDLGQEDSYAVLTAYMRDKNRAFIGTTTDAGTTKAFAVKYSDVTRTLVAELLSYEANVRWNSVEAVTSFMAEVDEPSDEYVQAAGSIFDGLPNTFDWSSITDTYGEALAEAVASKAATGTVQVTAAAPAPNGADLMAALKATVEGNASQEVAA